MMINAFYGSPRGAFIGQVPWVTSKGRYLLELLHESGRFRSLDIQNTYPRLDPDPRRNLPTSSRVPVCRVVVQSGPGRVGTQSGDNYSARRYPDIPPSPGSPNTATPPPLQGSTTGPLRARANCGINTGRPAPERSSHGTETRQPADRGHEQWPPVPDGPDLARQ